MSKYAARAHSIQHIPTVVERAVRMAVYGNPGPTYIELTQDVLYGTVLRSVIEYLPKVSPIPTLELPETTLRQIIDKLKNAKQPLVIVGKGVAYSRAEEVMRSFISKTNLPFLATPMGKGVVSDFDKNSANSARTVVLQNADVILLLGARLNWILHFGLPPRFRADVQFI